MEKTISDEMSKKIALGIFVLVFAVAFISISFTIYEGNAIYLILGVVVAILNICLFVKIWKMTNDVRELKEFFMKNGKKEADSTPDKEQPKVAESNNQTPFESMSGLK